MIDLGKKNLLGVQISVVDYESVVQQVLACARARRPLGVSALAVHGVMTGVLDPTHRHRLNHLDLLVPDGQPVRWALNLLYRTALADRVYGPELMLRVCRGAADEGLSVFLFGSTRGVLADLAGRLCNQFPALCIAGLMPSRFRKLEAEEKLEVIRAIRTSGAAITFVGIGCPRQEIWTYEFKGSLQMPVLAVGAAFRFHAGQTRQAPAILQRAGLEWLFRLSQEPWRLWKRYFLLNPLFVSLLCLQWARLRDFDPSDTRPPQRETWYG